MSASATTRSSSAAATTASSPRPTSRAPGSKTLVLERRPLVGGAAVTEEVFPGFKFSVFSYVVSLLRPEIIRDLDLPAHGLQILPLESTVTPLDNGDYLGRWADPDETRARARAATRRATPRPMVAVRPPDAPHGDGGEADPRHGPARSRRRWRRPTCAGLLKLGGHFRSLGAERFHALHKLMTMSSADYLDEWFEFDPLKATKSASGIIGTFLGPRSPGLGLRAAPPLHGRDRRRVPRLGLPEGRHRRDQRVDRERGARASAPRSAPTRPSSGSWSRTAARPAWRSRTARRSPRRSWSRASTRAAPSRSSSIRRSCRTISSRASAATSSAARRAR